MKIFKRFLFFFFGFLLIGCPLLDQDMCEIDTPLFIKNTTNEVIQVVSHLKIVNNKEDSLLMLNDLNLIYQFYDKPQLIRIIPANETIEMPGICKRGAMESPVYNYYYIVSLDTLQKYSLEEWDRKSGLKRYLFYNYSDFEEVNFTMEYP